MFYDKTYFFLVRETIRLAIQEDLGSVDITSLLIIPDESKVRAHLIAKDNLVLAGMPFVQEVFSAIDSAVQITSFFAEGSTLKRGDIIAEIQGPTKSLLAGERLALNTLQHVSGIATNARAFVERVKDLPVKIVDTRKTLPGLRFMEKYGVRTGGGSNHRAGLYDGILIKDNHIKIAGGVGKAVERAKTKAPHLFRIEVEVRDLDELKEALDAGAEVIMLDNMSLTDMTKAVNIVRSLKGAAVSTLLEASGNVSLDNVRAVAETGVDMISVGALTHSSRAVDISMKIAEEL
ncbi:MAG: carboxylating nicotinate-nucleotide diphosphorylase [Dissulfurispiraceae bacterium]